MLKSTSTTKVRALLGVTLALILLLASSAALGQSLDGDAIGSPEQTGALLTRP